MHRQALVLHYLLRPDQYIRIASACSSPGWIQRTKTGVKPTSSREKSTEGAIKSYIIKHTVSEDLSLTGGLLHVRGKSTWFLGNRRTRGAGYLRRRREGNWLCEARLRS